jgi:hypothetical protein
MPRRLWRVQRMRWCARGLGMGALYRARVIVGTVRQLIAILIALVTLWAREAPAGLPVPSLRLAIGFGVDTTASPAREVFDLWRRYLVEPSDSVRAGLWSEAERAKWRQYDLVAPYVYQGFSDYTVVRLAPAVGLPNTYLITTLVSAVEESTQVVRPLALYRVYATVEAGRWVLANALPRMTRTWRQENIGAISFVFPSTHTFDTRLARATAAFVDSLAIAFGQPAPQPISYYFTTDLEETIRALGLEFFPLGADTIGGRSNKFVRHVYVGASTNGEGYLHELAHIILAPEVGDRTSPLLAEGLMTWTGGSVGLSYPRLLPGLARYLAANPALSLETVMENPPPRIGSLDVGYDGLAVLCDLVHRRRGLAGLRAILQAGRTPAEVLDATARQLGISRGSLNSLWRGTILKNVAP